MGDEASPSNLGAVVSVRGVAVEDTGGPLKTPVGKGTLSRMFDVFGNAIDRRAAPTVVQWRTVHRAPPALARRSIKSEIFGRD